MRALRYRVCHLYPEADLTREAMVYFECADSREPLWNIKIFTMQTLKAHHCVGTAAGAYMRNHQAIRIWRIGCLVVWHG